MKDKQRKKAQKIINKNVKALNENIANDNLWRGRFIIRQTDAYWEKFDDGSGGILRVWLEIRDLKTGKYMGFSVDNYNPGWKLFENGNKFIAEYSGVWDNIDEVKNDKTNWSKIKWIPKEEIFGGSW